MFCGVVLPLLLIVVAGLSAGAVAYGTHPGWMLYPHGLEIILWSRRLEWLLVAVAIVGCVLLIAMALSGLRRAWWLFGLAPVLLLFGHRFSPHQATRWSIVENPAFVAPESASLSDSDWVVGLTFGDAAYACSYASLYSNPVVFLADHERRAMLMWSPFANRALAVQIARELKGHDLEVVGMPANALLLYNSRKGQFINGFTGQTPGHEKPAGFAGDLPIPTFKMPWKDWRALHPQCKVLGVLPANGSAAPAVPIQPSFPMPPMTLDRPASTLVALAGAFQPIAFEAARLTAAPMNSKIDGVPVGFWRESPESPVRAFHRELFDNGKLDLILQFVPNFNHRKHPTAFLVDVSSNTGWSADGACIDAPADVKRYKGRRLDPAGVDDAIAWGVAKFWYPQLQLDIPPAAPIAVEAASDNGDGSSHSAHRRARKPRLPKGQ